MSETVTEVSASNSTQTSTKEITRRVLGSSAIVSQDHPGAEINVSVDLDSFVHRLLLFDTYILHSVRLKEFPALLPYFGYEGVRDLLASGALEIRCDCIQMAEGTFFTPPIPQFTYQFHTIRPKTTPEYVHDCLQNIHHSSLKHSHVLKLKYSVANAITNPDLIELFRTEIAPDFEHELLHNARLVKAAIGIGLRRKHKAMPEFHVSFEKVGDDRYAADTDLPSKMNISNEEADQAIRVGLLAVAALCQRIAEMKAHSALSGFIDEDLPLFQEKLRILASLATSDRQEKRFNRVISIAGLRPFVCDPNVRINVDKLLEVRTSSEFREFRDWLPSIGSASDADIQDRVAGLNAKLGLFVHGNRGRAIRVLLSNALGLIPPPVGPILGTLASTGDTFLLDKVVRRSGIAAFVNELYPSIFESGFLSNRT